MAEKDKRIDAYIAKSASFAQPILKHVRKLIHKGCPDVDETIKWGMPSFDYKGQFFSMAAFKEHCSLGFWKASLLEDKHGYLRPIANKGGEAMGNFGRVTSINDLPSDKIILDYIVQAKKLNDEGIKTVRIPVKRKALKTPDYLLQALKKNKKALTSFENFNASNQRDYVEWITEAKTEATREKRIAQAIEWMEAGKPRNWKYMPAYQ